MTETNPTSRSNRDPATPDHGAGDPAVTTGEHGATAVHRTDETDRTDRYDRVEHHDHTTRDSFIGTNEPAPRHTNVSWGAIFAGVVTFIALVFVFGLVSIGLGLEEAGGTAVGIWSAIAVIVALGIAGFVSGMLSIRAGFLHGIATWATSLVATLVLVGWVGSSVLGALGGAVGNLTQGALQQTEISTEDLGNAADEADVDQQDLEQAQQDVEDTAQDAQDNLATSAWWSVAGLLIGAVVAGFAGAGGSRSVHTWHEDDATRTRVR